MFLDCEVTFRTTSPALDCVGKLVFLPAVRSDEGSPPTVSWKIWVLSTWIGNLVHQPEDETLLQHAGRPDLLDEAEEGHSDKIETDVFIAGAGSS